MKYNRMAPGQRLEQRKWLTLSALRLRLLVVTCLLSGVSVLYTFHSTVPPHAVEIHHQRISFMAVRRSTTMQGNEETEHLKLPVCECPGLLGRVSTLFS